MKHKFRKILTLSWHDLWILGQAWLLLLAIDLALRMGSLRRIQQGGMQGLQTAASSADPGTWATIQHLQRLVRIAASHHVYPMQCLQRSLALQRLLGQRGIGTELRIGVRKEAGRLHAHAWLEVQGQPIGETALDEVQFTELVAHGAGR